MDDGYRCVSSSTLFDNRINYPFAVSQSNCFGAAIGETRNRKSFDLSTWKREPKQSTARPKSQHSGPMPTVIDDILQRENSAATITSTTLFDNRCEYSYTITKTSLLHSKNDKQIHKLRVNAIAANSWIEFVEYFKKQNIPFDDECMHESVDIIHKQTRCGDELESCFITCKLCGKTERK